MNNESRMRRPAVIALLAWVLSTQGAFIAGARVWSSTLSMRDTSVWIARVVPEVEITGADWGKRWVVDTICTKDSAIGYGTFVVLSNIGASNARIRSIELLGDDAAAGYFRLDSSARATTILVGDEVRPGDDLRQRVIFKPTGERSYVANIRVITEAGDTTENILTGVGIESHGAITDVRFDTASFTGPWPITPEMRMTGSVIAKPTRPLTITDIIIDSAEGGDFTVDLTDIMGLPRILQPGQKMTFSVVFHPTRAGLHRARIAFTGDHSFCDDSTGVIEAYLTGPSGVDREEDAAAFTLEAASAIDDKVAIRYSLPAPTDVRVEIFNAIGERVALVAEGRFDAGEGAIVWEGARYPSGVYYCRMSAGSRAKSVRVMLLR